jgi:DNA invertase Pin-like site-specific DNA recombinase
LTLNVLLSFAQFEREVIGERIRDKIAASKKKGMWMGGVRADPATARNDDPLDGVVIPVSTGHHQRLDSGPPR